MPLQQAIIAALNTILPDLDGRIRQITEALEAEVIPFPNSGMSLGDIDRRLAELEALFQRLLEKAAAAKNGRGTSAPRCVLDGKNETAGCHRISGVAAFFSRRASDFLLY